ncbi:MAG TPA: ribonuclease HII [Geminicoccus sp.]|jgi:ribonuclease HII|uniref:ribonuclease HII n=1 Tax=Geminicoccus sp. TaxID=2024832 RepID=UPI002E34F3CA|nr:ribonuclease HII [Geminicoccus sp.]HEX2529087.1 ribonuclease HII [Geminicoccus sp.]
MRITWNEQVMIAGVDEVGRGPLAGPVVACAVILRAPIEGLADSKALPASERERLAALLRQSAVVALGAASVAEIARLNILHASMLAMRRAITKLQVRPHQVLVDGNRVPPGLELPAEAIVKGDALVDCIAAASIVAKVVRDQAMARLAQRWPGYGLERHAGYPTEIHRQALARLGPTPHHRLGFKGVLCVPDEVDELGAG